jgi:nitrate reductase NapE component
MTADDDKPSHRQANETTPVLLVSVAFVPLLSMAAVWALG